MSFLLEVGEELLLEEELCFWIHIYFYLIPLALIHVCGFSKGVFLWVPLQVCTSWFGNDLELGSNSLMESV